MTCASYEPLIALHAEGDLPPHESAGVEEHLAACPDCRAFAAELAESQQAIHELAQEDFDPRVLADVRRRVSAALPPASTRPRFAVVRFRPSWAMMAAAAIVMMAVLLQWRDRGAPAPTAPSVTERPGTPPPPPERQHATAPAATAARVPEAGSRPAHTRLRKRAREIQDKAAPLAATHALPQSQLVIKLVTSDPDVVIYWLVEQNGGKS